MALKKLIGDSTKKSPWRFIHSRFNPNKMVRADSAAKELKQKGQWWSQKK